MYDVPCHAGTLSLTASFQRTQKQLDVNALNATPAYTGSVDVNHIAIVRFGLHSGRDIQIYVSRVIQVNKQ